MSAGCKIIKEFERPGKELIEKFRDIPIANINDSMGRIAAVDKDIKPVNKGYLLGPAFTIRVPAGDNLMFHAAMDMARPGDVILIDAGGILERAIFGELMATYCKVKGIAGLVCDGAVRDIEGLAEMTCFPVYAKGVTSNGPYKNGPGEINVPIVIGGKVVMPGDIVIGDGDGLIIVKPEDAEEIAAAAKKINNNEVKTMQSIVGDGKFDRPWVMGKLKEIGCEII